MACCLPGKRAISVFHFSALAPHVRVLRGGAHAVSVNAVVCCGPRGPLATTDDEGRIGFWTGLQNDGLVRKCGAESIRAAYWWNDVLLVASASRLFVWRNQLLERSISLVGGAEEKKARRVMWIVGLDHVRVALGDSTGQVSVVDVSNARCWPPIVVGPSCLSAACQTDQAKFLAVSTGGFAYRLEVASDGSCVVTESVLVARSSLSAVASFRWFQVCAGDDGGRGWLLRRAGLPEEALLGHAAAVVSLCARGESDLVSLSNDQTVRIFAVSEIGLTALRKLDTCISQPSCVCVFRLHSLVVAGSQGFDELIESVD